MNWPEKFKDIVAVINIIILLCMMVILFVSSLVIPYFLHPICYIIGIPLAGIALWVIADVVEAIWG